MVYLKFLYTWVVFHPPYTLNNNQEAIFKIAHFHISTQDCWGNLRRAAARWGLGVESSLGKKRQGFTNLVILLPRKFTKMSPKKEAFHLPGPPFFRDKFVSFQGVVFFLEE